MAKDMLIKVTFDDVSIAFVEDGQLTEIFHQRQGDEQLMGNIYKGLVENVLPGMQAAFVNIGLAKNSFLHIGDILSRQGELQEADADINQFIKERQEIMVQIVKEPYGNKGARVSMYTALPGRYLVLLPYGEHIAISRRITDEEEVKRLKELAAGILPPGMGAIIRTASQNVEAEKLTDDLKSLLKTLKYINGKFVKAAPGSLIYRDFDLLQRVIRDTNIEDIDRIIVGSEDVKARVVEVAREIAPLLAEKISMRYGEDIFEKCNIYEQMERALQRKIWLDSGGYIIFDKTEALMVIDVNTGKYVGSKNFGDTVLKTNLEAAREIARQLRLRNIGGIIIVDFIDMEGEEDKKTLLEFLEKEFAKDRIKVTILGMTALGLVEITRKKLGQELANVLEKECPACKGKGRVGIGVRE